MDWPSDQENAVQTACIPPSQQDADKLGSFFRGPRQISRRFLFSQAKIGFLGGVQKGGDLTDVAENPCDKGIRVLLPARAFDRDIDM